MTHTAARDASEQAALALCRAGYRVHPLHGLTTAPNGKPRCTCGRPGCLKAGNAAKHPRTKHGCLDAAAGGDVSAVEALWEGLTRGPSNVGVATGQGLCVVDLDPRHGGDEAWAELVAAGGGSDGGPAVVLTGGGGQHLYYRVPDGATVSCSVGKLGAGVDVRGEGGYVVAPPSSHVSGTAYAWELGGGGPEVGPDGVVPMAALPLVPAWLMAALERVERGRTAKMGDDGEVADGDRPPPGYAKALYIGGERNVRVCSMGGALRRIGNSQSVIAAGLMALNLDRCRPPLDEREVLHIAKSVCRWEPADPVIRLIEKRGVLEGEEQGDGAESGQGDGVDGGQADDASWRKALCLGSSGGYLATGGNAVLLLSHDPDWRGCLGTNEFSYTVEWRREPPAVDGTGTGGGAGSVSGPKAWEPPQPGERLRDGHLLYIQQWLIKRYGVNIPKDALYPAVGEVGRTCSFHPVRDWLRSLKWDGNVRCLTWLSDLLGVELSEYSSEVGRAWLVSAVARVMRPGCQADHVLVLEGMQGAGKSTVMEALFGVDWYLGALPDIRNKDAQQGLRGKWGIEIGELDAIRGAGASKTKDFITQRVDEFREPYGRLFTVQPRQCVFVGTTNEERWMVDATGGRRFWPVKVTKIDREAMKQARDMLWAEALVRFEGDEKWWPEHKQVGMFESEQEERYQSDAWEDVLTEYLEGRNLVTVEELITHCLRIDIGKVTRSDQTRLGYAMTRCGWRSKRHKVGGSKRVVYIKVGLGGFKSDG